MAKQNKRKKPGRAQTIEEIFASVSTISAAGLNPPPQRVVLTPRSAEACLKFGINPESLRIRDLDSFREPGIDPAVQRMRHEAYSQRRHEHVKIVRAARKKLYSIEGGSKSVTKKQVGQSTGSKADNSAMIELEQRRLQKIQQRQQKEIENMLQFELKMNEISEDANRKLELEKRKEEKMERDKLKRGQKMAEQRRIRDLKKKAQEDAEEEKRQQVAYAMFLKDKEQADQQARKERLQQIEMRSREEERGRKAEEYRLQTAAILKQQQDAIIKRLEEMDEAESIRTEMITQHRKERRKQLQQKRKGVEKRISKNLKNAKDIERKRKDDFDLKQQQVGEQRSRLRMAAEQEQELARKQQKLLERKREMVLEEARYEEEMRKEELLSRQEAMEENLARIQAGQERERQLKKEVKLLNHQMKHDNVERMKRIEEYKRLETIRKLKEAEQRTEQLQQQKQDLLFQRKQASIHAKIQKDNIVAAMEQVKITKKWSKASKQMNSAMMTTSSSSSKLTKSRKLKADKSMTKTDSLPNLSSQGPSSGSKQAEAMPSAYKSPYDGAGNKVTI